MVARPAALRVTHRRGTLIRALKNPKWIVLKGILFLLLGLTAGLLALLEHPTLEFALLLVLTVWCACRFYYFLFYVIEHYVDPNYRYSGVFSMLHHLMHRRRAQYNDTGSDTTPRRNP